MIEEQILWPIPIENVESSTIHKLMKIFYKNIFDEIHFWNGYAWTQTVVGSVKFTEIFIILKFKINGISGETIQNITEWKNCSGSLQTAIRPVRVLSVDVSWNESD